MRSGFGGVAHLNQQTMDPFVLDARQMSVGIHGEQGQVEEGCLLRGDKSIAVMMGLRFARDPARITGGLSNFNGGDSSADSENEQERWGLHPACLVRTRQIVAHPPRDPVVEGSIPGVTALRPSDFFAK